jgi:uncharacterized protein YndB with AHSA1/START domain
MAKAYASAIIRAPVGAVWRVVRDFNALPTWFPMIVASEIEDGRAGDCVGCVRSFRTGTGLHVRERLLALDDLEHRVTYNFEKAAFPVENYLATFRLLPVTADGSTFAEWEATFDEAPEDAGKYVAVISNEIFAEGLKALNATLMNVQRR